MTEAEQVIERRSSIVMGSLFEGKFKQACEARAATGQSSWVPSFQQSVPKVMSEEELQEAEGLLKKLKLTLKLPKPPTPPRSSQ